MKGTHCFMVSVSNRGHPHHLRHLPEDVFFFNLLVGLLYNIPFSPLQCSSHPLLGGTDQRRAHSPGTAGSGRATWTRRRLWGWNPGRAAKETSGAESLKCPQQSQEAGAAPVRTADVCRCVSLWSKSPLWAQITTFCNVSCRLSGWQRRKCANRSWGREWGWQTMRWWRDFGGSWPPGRRNALQQRRRKIRPGKH